MKIKLSDHFTYGRLLRFTLPSVVMMVIASDLQRGGRPVRLQSGGRYGSLGRQYHLPRGYDHRGLRLHAGDGGQRDRGPHTGRGPPGAGSAVLLHDYLRRDPAGGVLTVVSVWLTEPIARLAGASDALIRDCVVYGRILLLGSVPFMLQVCFQSFCGGGAAQLGLAYSIAAGVTNMVLDYVLIAVFHLGIAGRPSLPCWGMLWAASFRCSILPRGAFRPAADQEPALSQAAASGVQQRLIRTDEQHLLLGDQHFV